MSLDIKYLWEYNISCPVPCHMEYVMHSSVIAMGIHNKIKTCQTLADLLHSLSLGQKVYYW